MQTGEMFKHDRAKVAGSKFLPSGICSASPGLFLVPELLLDREIGFYLVEDILFRISVAALKHIGYVIESRIWAGR